MKTILTFIVLSLSASFANAALVTTFDSGLEGWTVEVNGPPPGGALHVLAGGNLGGYMQATDATGGTYVFAAPSKFLGDISQFNGGVLSFDAKIFDLDGFGILAQGGIVTISGPTSSAILDLAINGYSESWETYSAPLASANWTIDELTWQALLGNVTSITIIMDSTNGNDTTGLDNFSVAAPVPLPAALYLFSVALGLLGWVKLKA